MTEHFANRKFQIVYDDLGNAKILKEDGEEIQGFDYHWIKGDLKFTYGYKRFIYIAKQHGWVRLVPSEQHWYKIGVTNDIRRREREIDGWIIHHIVCNDDRAFEFEKKLHDYFGELRIQGEWFALDADPEYDFLGMLKELNTHRDLTQWLKKADVIQPGHHKMALSCKVEFVGKSYETTWTEHEPDLSVFKRKPQTVPAE